jgi:hypothetical protein
MSLKPSLNFSGQVSLVTGPSALNLENVPVPTFLDLFNQHKLYHLMSCGPEHDVKIPPGLGFAMVAYLNDYLLHMTAVRQKCQWLLIICAGTQAESSTLKWRSSRQRELFTSALRAPTSELQGLGMMISHGHSYRGA